MPWSRRSAPSACVWGRTTLYGSRITEVAMFPIGFVSFVMTQRMLRGIKARAEAVS